MKPGARVVGRVEAAEAATVNAGGYEKRDLLARMSDRELDLLEDALLAGDAQAAETFAALAEQRLAAGAPPWMDTAEAARAREAERRAYWNLLPAALAEQARTGRPIDYPALEREARAEAERSTQ